MPFAYPADKFETIAHLIFDFEGTFKDKMQKEASVSTNIAYDAESDSIVTFYGGKGGAYFKQNGYVNNNDGTYSVFFQEGDWDENGNEFSMIVIASSPLNSRKNFSRLLNTKSSTA